MSIEVKQGFRKRAKQTLSSHTFEKLIAYLVVLSSLLVASQLTIFEYFETIDSVDACSKCWHHDLVGIHTMHAQDFDYYEDFLFPKSRQNSTEPFHQNSTIIFHSLSNQNGDMTIHSHQDDTEYESSIKAIIYNHVNVYVIMETMELILEYISFSILGIFSL